jgi:outer membrane protein TolC
MRRVLQGEKPESLGVEFPRAEGLSVNMATARVVGKSLPYATLLEAEIVGADLEPGDGIQAWTFQSAVEEGVKANLELAASDKGVLAGQQTIREAFSLLLPKLEASTLALAIDEDRAASSMGQHAEYTWSASLALTQILYSELAWANVDIQKCLQKGREAARERLRLDITQETAKTYINYLRAKVLEKVQTDYLRRVRGHLETARVRQAAGVANPSEVYRWENEVANSRRNLTDAQAKRGMAQAALNRLLHRPQEEPFIAATITTADSPFTAPDAPIEACLNTPAHFEALRDFLVAEGLDRAPELKQYEAGIAAQERGLLATKRSFYTPTVGMQAEVKEDFWEEGPGAEGPAFPVGLLVKSPDNHNWNVGVKASVPVYAGGGRNATKKRIQLQVEQLQLEREAAREKLELRIRAASQAARASRQSIAEAAKSLEAAQKTLELVMDGYERGLLSIVELLDAQAQALIAEQLNANAMYSFMLDLMDLQRAVASFEFSMTAEERSSWQRRLEDFMARRNAPVEVPAGPITQGR